MFELACVQRTPDLPDGRHINRAPVPRRERISQPNSTRESLPLSLSGFDRASYAGSQRTLICNQADSGKSFRLGERIASTKLCRHGNREAMSFLC